MYQDFLENIGDRPRVMEVAGAIEVEIVEHTGSSALLCQGSSPRHCCGNCVRIGNQIRQGRSIANLCVRGEEHEDDCGHSNCEKEGPRISRESFITDFLSKTLSASEEVVQMGMTECS